MFLSSVQPALTSFDFIRDHGINCEKTAVETELGYLADFDGSDICVDSVGSHLVLEGTVASSSQAERAVKVAREIVGYDRLISRLVVVHPTHQLAPLA